MRLTQTYKATLAEAASTELLSVYNRLQSVFTIKPEKLRPTTARFVNELRVGMVRLIAAIMNEVTRDMPRCIGWLCLHKIRPIPRPGDGSLGKYFRIASR
jgi:hypothetical protein